MSFMADEIAQQPTAWRTAAAVAARSGDLLPAPGERVAVVGCGTSWHIAEVYAVLRETAGQGETDFFTPAQLPPARAYDRVVAITRSGTTTEVVQLLDTLPATRTVSITADPNTPVGTRSEHCIALEFADERSVVQTLFATTALAFLRASLGEDIAPLAAAAEAALAGPLAVVDPAGWEQFTFLGSGWAHGLAREAALKLREAALSWTESYPVLEYRHGPIAIAQPGRLIWVLGASAPGLEEQVRATGATFLCTGSDPLVDLVQVHRLARELAEAHGLDPDHPRHLSRSVVLAP